MSQPIAFLSPAETAGKLGVTVRALRLYERRGLVAPVRTRAGWRAFGPDQIARLHQVLALKRLGLPLARIGELLGGRLASLDAVLAMQEQALLTRHVEAERALRSVRSARARLARGEALSVDDLTHLTQETTMTQTMTDDEWCETFEPLWKKHMTPEQIAEAEKRKAAMMGEFDQHALSAQWDAVIADAERARAKGDPGSREAFDVVRRWKALQEQFTEGDYELTMRSAAMWKEALSDPNAAPKLPMSLGLWEWVTEAARRWREAGSPA